MFVIYATDRNDIVREIERVATIERAMARCSEHNREESDEWVETGYRGEQWAYIPAHAWEDFREMWNEHESMSVLRLAR